MVAFNPNSLATIYGNLMGYAYGRDNTETFQLPKWDMELWREIDKNMRMAETVEMVPANLISGKYYTQPKIGRMGARAKIPGQPAYLQAFKETEWTMEFRRHMESSFSQEDIAAIYADINYRGEYIAQLAYALSMDIDRWLLGLRVVPQRLGLFVQANDGADTPANTSLNYGALLAAKTMMDQADVPDEDRMWMLSPSQRNSLLTEEKVINGDYNTGNAVMSGQVGTLLGYPLLINNNITKNSVDGLRLISGVAGDGTREYTTHPTPGFAVWDTDADPDVAVVSPYYPNKNLNGDPNGAGQHTELEVSATQVDSLPAGQYTGMLVRRSWAKMGMVSPIKTETGRETTYLADVVVSDVKYDAKCYRPEEGIVLIHSNEPV